MRKRSMHWFRRLHLYLGLLLFPWSILYGITAFLFNHPTAFSDQPMATFHAATLKGTPLETLPVPQEIATAVIAHLNETQQPVTPYRLAGEARYNREFAFATVQAEGQTISLLFDMNHGGGTVRSAPTAPPAPVEQPPFVMNHRPERTTTITTKAPPGIVLPNPVPERVRASVPVVLERMGFPTGTTTVTSVPEVTFPIEADGRIWMASYNPMSGAITGSLGESKPKTELSARRFLLRLHTAHGYPGEANAKWFWAIIVDVMAFVLCFWGVSGLLMWWQIKASRKLGVLLLVLSAIAAAGLGYAMHSAMSG